MSVTRGGSLIAAVCIAAGIACGAVDQAPRFTREIPWHGRGIWLKADTHIHTEFSDGKYSVEDVIARAAGFGCQVVAITDHLDGELDAATPEYFAAIDAARRAHSEMIVLAGGEWSIPPWGGDEHATVLVHPAVERKLVEFKRDYDDYERPTHDPALAGRALQWLAAQAAVEREPPVIIYEHPSRADDRSAANGADMRAWRSVNDLFIGFAGAPGHQGIVPAGDYHKEQTIDRWDPVVARPGDAWDMLLADGLDLWGAYAPSDFHTDGGTLKDRWPCQFSATWLYAPRRDAAAVLQAFRAGSFFAEHGGIVREAELRVSAPGLPRPAIAGEAIAVPRAASVTVDLSFRATGTTWSGASSRVDRVQLITVDATGTRIAVDERHDGQPMLTRSLQVPPGGLVIRARGYADTSAGDRLAFYTNPVRVTSPR